MLYVAPNPTVGANPRVRLSVSLPSTTTALAGIEGFLSPLSPLGSHPEPVEG